MNITSWHRYLAMSIILIEMPQIYKMVHMQIWSTSTSLADVVDAWAFMVEFRFFFIGTGSRTVWVVLRHLKHWLKSMRNISSYIYNSVNIECSNLPMRSVWTFSNSAWILSDPDVFLFFSWSMIFLISISGFSLIFRFDLVI